MLPPRKAASPPFVIPRGPKRHRVEDVAPAPRGWERDRALAPSISTNSVFSGASVPAQSCARSNRATGVPVQRREHHSEHRHSPLERAGSGMRVGTSSREEIDYRKLRISSFDSRCTTTPHFRCHYREQIASPIKLGDNCPKCGSQRRPDVVWFGEAVDMRQEYLDELVKRADIFIGVGTPPRFTRLPARFRFSGEQG